MGYFLFLKPDFNVIYRNWLDKGFLTMVQPTMGLRYVSIAAEGHSPWHQLEQYHIYWL